MRKLISGLFLTCLVLIVASTASAQLSRFQGNWRNIDPGTGGITRLQITTNPSVRVHAWGKCHPSDCDQGTVDGFAYGPNVSSNLNATARAVSAIFRTNFNESIFIIRPTGVNRLQADVYDRFTDNSGRTAFVATYTFARQAGPVVSRQDCLPYNPNNLRIENEGASGWLLTDGSSRMLILDNRADAERALALARRHRAHCFIGRDNRRPNRKDFIMEYWTGDSGMTTTITGEDCLPYNPSNLEIRNEGASGWLLTDGNSRMVMLDNRADAEQALGVASGSSRHCFIGRNNNRPNRKDYITQYWR